MVGFEDRGLEMVRERVRAARLREEHLKLLAGGDLFDAVIERMRWGIKSENPCATDEEIKLEVVRRLELARRLEQFE